MTNTKEIVPMAQEGMNGIIAKAMESGDVATLEKLLSMNERIMAKNAEIAFNQAMARLQQKLPIIHQASQIKHGDKLIARYAKYEDIDRQIRHLYVAEGFSMSYDSVNNDDKTVTYTGKVSHIDGHSRDAQIVLPADTGPGRNAVQSHGSTITYAKRYLLTMLLNLVFTNDDDDGNASGAKPSTEDMTKTLEELIVKVGADRQKFLEHFNVTEVADLAASDYAKAQAMLKAKGAKK